MKILMGSRMEGAKKEDDFMFLYHLHILLWRGTPLFYKRKSEVDNNNGGINNKVPRFVYVPHTVLSTLHR